MNVTWQDLPREQISLKCCPLSQSSDGKYIVLQVAIQRSDDMGGATFWIGAGTVEIAAVKKTE